MTLENYELSTTQQTAALSPGETIVTETNDYTIVKLENGLHRKDMKYKKQMTYIPSSKEEMIELYKILNTEDNPDVTPMKKLIGEEIEILHYFTNPYQSFDDKTGGSKNGCNTTILTKDGYVATSSLTVYWTIDGLVQVFGSPSNENYTPIKVKVTETKKENGMQIGLELISV